MGKTRVARHERKALVDQLQGASRSIATVLERLSDPNLTAALTLLEAGIENVKPSSSEPAQE